MTNSDAPISFSFAGLPEGYCFSGFDRLFLDAFKRLSGFIPGEYSVIIDKESEPNPVDRSKLWHKQLAGGAPTGKLFSYYLGKWVTPHPIEPESQERMWWTGTEAELWAYDGGDGTDPSASAPTATTGAMWERDEDWDFRFPLAMGTSPAPHSTTVNPGDTGGEEYHTLSQAETPLRSHNHQDGTPQQAGSDIYNWFGRVADGASKAAFQSGITAADKSLTSTESEDGAAHSIMPPYKVGLWAMRTARAYFVA
jgi:hypothetical protein